MTEEKSLTSIGKKILQAVPVEGIGERTLIERLGGLGAYSDYHRMIHELLDAGYLVKDTKTHTVRRSE